MRQGQRMNFFSELKRRNVYKVAVAYAVVAWLLIQAASILFPTFEAPSWAMKVLVALLVLGFPVALVLSWAFEITPEGIKLESEIDPKKSITRTTGRKIVGLTIAVAIVAAGLLVFQMVARDGWARRSAEGNAEDGRPRGPSLPLPEKGLPSCLSIISAGTRTTLTFAKACRMKSSRGWQG